MVSVTNKSLMLSVIILIVVVLSGIMLSVVAPIMVQAIALTIPKAIPT
jgi:hypothetical protein